MVQIFCFVFMRWLFKCVCVCVVKRVGQHLKVLSHGRQKTTVGLRCLLPPFIWIPEVQAHHYACTANNFAHQPFKNKLLKTETRPYYVAWSGPELVAISLFCLSMTRIIVMCHHGRLLIQFILCLISNSFNLISDVPPF